uniref:C-type lectin domain-containing protein n=1 Tax=Gouania willdenowi TaxID=441366 RepID=A0A8C5E6D2_GOUWI
MKNQIFISIKYNHSVRILLSKTLMIVSTGSQLDPEVFFVNLYKTWPVAQQYCRENYVDLVTVTNNKVVEKINSETGGSKGWIGLHRAPNFFWSDGSNFTFTNWDSVHNKLNSMKVICNMKNQIFISIKYNHRSQLDPNVFFVNSSKTWPVAQKYCRENYVDLVTVTNIKVVEKINNETGGSQVWIGLHRAPNFFWSDGSNFTFSNWDFVRNKLNSMKVICAVTSSTKGGKWKFLSCEEKLPFVCYSLKWCLNKSPFIKKTETIQITKQT